MKQDSTITQLLVTPRDAARMLCISERTVWSLSQSGVLNVVRIGRSVRYAVADIEDYIERRRRDSLKVRSRESIATSEH